MDSETSNPTEIISLIKRYDGCEGQNALDKLDYFRELDALIKNASRDSLNNQEITETFRVLNEALGQSIVLLSPLLNSLMQLSHFIECSEDSRFNILRILITEIDHRSLTINDHAKLLSYLLEHFDQYEDNYKKLGILDTILRNLPFERDPNSLLQMLRLVNKIVGKCDVDISEAIEDFLPLQTPEFYPKEKRCDLLRELMKSFSFCRDFDGYVEKVRLAEGLVGVAYLIIGLETMDKIDRPRPFEFLRSTIRECIVEKHDDPKLVSDLARKLSICSPRVKQLTAQVVGEIEELPWGVCRFLSGCDSSLCDLILEAVLAKMIEKKQSARICKFLDACNDKRTEMNAITNLFRDDLIKLAEHCPLLLFRLDRFEYFRKFSEKLISVEFDGLDDLVRSKDWSVLWEKFCDSEKIDELIMFGLSEHDRLDFLEFVVRQIEENNDPGAMDKIMVFMRCQHIVNSQKFVNLFNRLFQRFPEGTCEDEQAMLAIMSYVYRQLTEIELGRVEITPETPVRLLGIAKHVMNARKPTELAVKLLLIILKCVDLMLCETYIPADKLDHIHLNVQLQPILNSDKFIVRQLAASCVHRANCIRYGNPIV